jgi:hypothetical protein
MSEAVEPLISLVLVQLQLGRRVAGKRWDGPPVGMDAQRDLLRHRPAGHEDRGRLAEDGPQLVLQGLDRATRAVPVDPQVRRDLGKEARGRPVPVRVQRTRTRPPVSLEIVLVVLGHR